MQIYETTFMSEARIFKALMHPLRIALLEVLREGEQCVCQLEERLNMRQAYISQQLAVLRKAGIIADRRCGLNIFYRIAKPEVLDLIDLAHAMTSGAPFPASGEACAQGVTGKDTDSGARTSAREDAASACSCSKVHRSGINTLNYHQEEQ